MRVYQVQFVVKFETVNTTSLMEIHFHVHTTQKV